MGFSCIHRRIAGCANGSGVGTKEDREPTMSIGRINLPNSKPLVSLDAEQEKRSDQLIELEIAERLPTRFVIAAVTQRAAEESIVGSDGAVGCEERKPSRR